MAVANESPANGDGDDDEVALACTNVRSGGGGGGMIKPGCTAMGFTTLSDGACRRGSSLCSATVGGEALRPAGATADATVRAWGSSGTDGDGDRGTRLPCTTTDRDSRVGRTGATSTSPPTSTDR